MSIKKWLLSGLSVLTAFGLAACGNEGGESGDSAEAGNHIDTLSVEFVPSRDPEEIITVTDPLKDILKEELEKQGFTIDNVDINVGTSYEATGEALEAGTTDVGFIPGGTYVLYEEGIEPILTATRGGLSVTGENPQDWNKEPVTKVDDQVTYYHGLILAGPSEKGQELAEKVNNGEELNWEDLNSANWSVMGTSSPAGYIYPSLWLQDHYGKNITDLDNVVQADSYASAFARLASGQVDVMVTYADARLDNEEKWQEQLGGSDDIWKEVQVIGVTKPMMNDTISVSKNSENMTPELAQALQEAFINIAQTEEGQEIIAVYTHEGYEKAEPSDYDTEREAQKLVQEMN